MPFALNFIYIATLIFYAPVLLYRMIRSAKYRDGLWEKFWGKAPDADRRETLPLVSRGERGRGAAAPPPGSRDGQAQAELGDRDLDDHHHRTGHCPPDLSRPDHVLRTARL